MALHKDLQASESETTVIPNADAQAPKPEKAPLQKVPPLPQLTPQEHIAAAEFLNELFMHDESYQAIVTYIFLRATKIVTTMDLFDQFARYFDHPLSLPRDLLPHMEILQERINAAHGNIVLAHEQRGKLTGYIIRLRTEADTVLDATRTSVKTVQGEIPHPATWLEQSLYTTPDQALSHAVLTYLIERRGKMVTLSEIVDTLPPKLQSQLDRTFMRDLMGKIRQDESCPYGIIHDGSLARFTFDAMDRLLTHFSPQGQRVSSNFREPNF